MLEPVNLLNAFNASCLSDNVKFVSLISFFNNFKVEISSICLSLYFFCIFSSFVNSLAVSFKDSVALSCLSAASPEASPQSNNNAIPVVNNPTNNPIGFANIAALKTRVAVAAI